MTNQEIVMGFVALLDEALLCDREATENLLRVRVSCNERMAGHPTIQVGPNQGIGKVPPVTTTFSVLGLINGICEKLTGERVCAVVDNSGVIQRFGIYAPFKEQNETDITRATGADGPGSSRG